MGNHVSNPTDDMNVKNYHDDNDKEAKPLSLRSKVYISDGDSQRAANWKYWV